jgi:hypothetical protein
MRFLLAKCCWELAHAIVTIIIRISVLRIPAVPLQLRHALRIANGVLVITSGLLIIFRMIIEVLLLIFIDIHVVACVIYLAMIIDCWVHVLHIHNVVCM